MFFVADATNLKPSSITKSTYTADATAKANKLGCQALQVKVTDLNFKSQVFNSAETEKKIKNLDQLRSYYETRNQDKYDSLTAEWLLLLEDSVAKPILPLHAVIVIDDSDDEEPDIRKYRKAGAPATGAPVSKKPRPPATNLLDCLVGGSPRGSTVSASCSSSGSSTSAVLGNNTIA